MKNRIPEPIRNAIVRVDSRLAPVARLRQIVRYGSAGGDRFPVRLSVMTYGLLMASRVVPEGISRRFENCHCGRPVSRFRFIAEEFNENQQLFSFHMVRRV